MDFSVVLRQGFAARWMNVYPHDGKRSGGYMNGGAYDVHPYLLLNHNGDYSSLSTFAHEWGHAVHTLLTKRNQPFELSNYATFVAETAAISNEVLVQNYVIARAKSKEAGRFGKVNGHDSKEMDNAPVRICWV